MPCNCSPSSTYIAFLTDARRRGDEYAVLDWIPEHHDAVIADAPLRYTTTAPTGRVHLRAFVEIDRATMSSERLAAKLVSYARLLDYTPTPPGRRSIGAAQNSTRSWQKYCPLFPRVLFVITNCGDLALAHRIADLRAMATAHPRAAHLVGQVPADVARLEDLETHGPSAAVWTPLDGRERPCGWMGL